MRILDEWVRGYLLGVIGGGSIFDH
jgi:hypothetical protein